MTLPRTWRLFSTNLVEPFFPLPNVASTLLYILVLSRLRFGSSKKETAQVLKALRATELPSVHQDETIRQLGNQTCMSALRTLVALLGAMILASSSPLLAGSRNPVVVELFTSEGCSSCPPADALLAKLNEQGVVNGAEVLALGEHVDYWNHLGWTDGFSSPAFTQRQESYARRFGLGSAYTPQMVIDGRFEAVGNDPGLVEREISRAARLAKTATVTLSWTGGNAVQVAVEGAGGEPSAVLLAVTEDSLTSSVARGENGGRTLRHNAVVRELSNLGNTSAGVFRSTVPLTLPASWKAPDLRVVVFVQRPGNREIVGAASVKYHERQRQ
jgi:hypothetical protein